MLSSHVHKFLKKIIGSDGNITKVIDTYVYSERYAMAIDFELIYIKTLTNIKSAINKDDLQAQALISLNFFNKLIAGDNLEQILTEYDSSKRELMASIVYNIKEKLLKSITVLNESKTRRYSNQLIANIINYNKEIKDALQSRN
jgi:hypothetical protein